VKNHDKTDRLQAITDPPEPTGDDASFQPQTSTDPGDNPRPAHSRASRKAPAGEPLFDRGIGDQPGMDHTQPGAGTPLRIHAVAEDPQKLTPPSHPTLSERTEDLTLLGSMLDTLAGRLATGHWCQNCLADLAALASHYTWKAGDHPAA